MKRRLFHRLTLWLPLSACIACVLCLSLNAHTSPSPPDSVHHCVILDEAQWLREPSGVAGKVAAERNVGEPRTVRMIYFLPNDRPYRQSVVDTMKKRMIRYQRFYGEQMEAHGYGYMTFRYEADAEGAPVVHGLDGEHGDWHYDQSTWSRVWPEVRQAYGEDNVVLFVVIDNRDGGTIGSGTGTRRVGGGAVGYKDRGKALVPGGFGFLFTIGLHELGHAFGMMWHDYRDRAHIMGPSHSADRLSACSAAYLSVSPYFNPAIPLEKDRSSLPAIELLSPERYAAGTLSLFVRLAVADADGLHQLIALVPTPGTLSQEVHGCRVLSGETVAEIEYAYDGAIPSGSRGSPTTLSDPPTHVVGFVAVDGVGDRKYESFVFAQRSPYHLATLEGHTDDASRVAISPDGSLLASGSRDKTVKLWDTKTREEIATLDMSGPDGQIFSLAFSPDGSLLAAGTPVGDVTLWDVASRRLAGALKGHTSWAYTLAFSPDGGTLVSGSLYDEDRIKVWDVATRQLRGVLKGHTSGMRQVAFSPDGSILASGSSDGTVRIWDLDALRERYRLVRIRGGPVSSIAFSPDGKILAADDVGKRVIALWDVASRRNYRDLGQVHATKINYLTFSPDGESLATAGSEGTVIVRDVATGKVRQRFPHTDAPKYLAYWPDGSVLAAGTYENKVELWDTSEWVRRRPARVDIVSGLEQRGVPGTPLPAPFVVSVRDENGDAFPGMRVIFDVTGGGALSATAARTDTSGNAATTLTLGGQPGMNTVTARAAGLSPAVFTAMAWGSPDVNGDGKVDFGDFVVFAGKYGLVRDAAGYDARCDLDGDGTIGFSDFVIFAGAFGKDA